MFIATHSQALENLKRVERDSKVEILPRLILILNSIIYGAVFQDAELQGF